MDRHRQRRGGSPRVTRDQHPISRDEADGSTTRVGHRSSAPSKKVTTRRSYSVWIGADAVDVAAVGLPHLLGFVGGVVVVLAEYLATLSLGRVDEEHRHVNTSHQVRQGWRRHLVGEDRSGDRRGEHERGESATGRQSRSRGTRGRSACLRPPTPRRAAHRSPRRPAAATPHQLTARGHRYGPARRLGAVART